MFARLALPILSKFNSSLTKLILFIRQYENFIEGFFLGLAIALSSSLIPNILRLASSFLILQKSTLIITSIATLIGLLVDDFLAWKNNGNALFSSLYESLDRFWNRLKDFREFISNLFNYITDRFSSMWNDIGNQMSKVKNILAKPFKFLISSKEERNVNTNDNNRKSSMPLLYNPYLVKTNNDSANNINNNSSTINISNIDINTRATDANAIADSLLTEIQKRTIMMNQSNYGIR